ncbi:carotenoid oxygenase [Paraphysoderma sedebokerense]|nr:carotenoid oxygenase [Paraphysoderma sedebokerense]
MPITSSKASDFRNTTNKSTLPTKSLYRLGLQNGIERPNATHIEVSSQRVPSTINGVLYLNCCGKFSVPLPSDGSDSTKKSFRVGHWFDALPMLVRIHIRGRDNCLVYTSKFIANGVEEFIEDQECMNGITFDTESEESERNIVSRMLNSSRFLLGWYSGIADDQRLIERPFVVDRFDEELASGIAARNGVVVIRECLNENGEDTFPTSFNFREKRKLATYSNMNLLQECDEISLDPVRVFSFTALNDEVKGTLCASRPYVDKRQNTLVNVIINTSPLTNKALFTVFSLPISGSTSILDSPSPVGNVLAQFKALPIFLHAIAVTDNYVILPLHDFTLHLGALGTVRRGGLLERARWSEEKIRWVVVNVESREVVAVFLGQEGFIWHIINAWETEDDDSIFIDATIHPDPEIIQFFDMEELLNSDRQVPTGGMIVRTHLSRLKVACAEFGEIGLDDEAPDVWNCSDDDIPDAEFSYRSDFSVDFPTINPKFQGKETRYCWGLASSEDSSWWNTIVKVDLKSKSRVGAWSQEGCFPGELNPVYVGTKEEDVVFVAVVLNSIIARSEALFINGETMCVMCKIQLPDIIPLSFGSGDFVKDDEHICEE